MGGWRHRLDALLTFVVDGIRRSISLYVLLFFPTARFMVVQLSPLVLLVLMHTVWRMADNSSLDENVEANVRVATLHTTS